MADDAKFSVYSKIEESPPVAVHGQVATKSHIVRLMLDLVGYTPDRPLRSMRLLDPGCGCGEFIVEAARRLASSAVNVEGLRGATDCLLGVEKDAALADRCRKKLRQVLEDAGLPKPDAEELSEKWVVCDDYLMHSLEACYDFVVGNPPYVRQEAIPKDALARYREQFSCLYDRADLYVAFFQKSLELLSHEGTLGFICPDRFTRNKYGKKLRRLITERFHVRQVIDLAQASPFEPEVICYPGIFIIGRDQRKHVDYVRVTDADPAECEEVRKALANGNTRAAESERVAHHRYDHWFTGEEQWAIASPAHTALLRRLENAGVPLGSSSSGCSVGIGLATGADSVFIVNPEAADVEPQLLLPLVTTRDVATGHVNWSSHFLINPFDPDHPDRLIDLDAYPRAGRYFRAHEQRLRRRHVGKRNPTGWYRTIDRVSPTLRKRPKLLIPDIKGENVVALDKGEFYPHHNLYFVTSQYWDLRALRTILRSSVAKFFVWMYGVKMRGGFLRFQAQYLRQICIPMQKMDVSEAAIRTLIDIDDEQDIQKIDAAVARCYGLTEKDLNLIQDISISR